MPDDQVRTKMLEGVVGSDNFLACQSELNMRFALRVAQAAQEMAVANRDLVKTTENVVKSHEGLIKETRYLVWATWGLVFITFIAQAGLIGAEYLMKKSETSESSPKQEIASPPTAPTTP